MPFVPVDDPVLPLPSADEMERALREHPQEFVAYLTERQHKIELRTQDPLRHGYEPKIWHIVDDLLVRGNRVVLIDPTDSVPKEIMGGGEVYVSGANRSSKSEYGGRTIVKRMFDKGMQRAWCFHMSGPRSVQQQQPRVWKFIPPEWKQIRKHHTAYIRYKPATGFSGEPPTFVGTNGSQCWFLNYAMDVGSLEGDEIDIAWMTELAPWEFIEAVRFRLAQRAGDLIIDFTPKDGFTPTVAKLTESARDVVRVPAPLLPKLGAPGGCETVPRVQKANPGTNPDLSIVYFHLSDNPFANAGEVIKKARAGGRKSILERVYGVAEKLAGNLFPTFNRKVHMIKEGELPKDGTNKQYIDPCSGRNPAMIWGRALPDTRTVVIYREWPSPGSYIRGVGDPGWWAELDAKKPDGKQGDAQKPWGFGLQRWIEEILIAEGWNDAEIEAAVEAMDCTPPKTQRNGPASKIEAIYERVMDSRFGNAPTLAKGETVTLIESLSELGMNFEPAPGEHMREGIDQIHDLLWYEEDRRIDHINRPRLLVTENCKNVLWMFENYTGLDGQHGASKDFADLVRYLALDPPVYMEPDSMRSRGGGAY